MNGDIVTAAAAETLYVKLGADRIAYRVIGAGKTMLLVNRFRGTLDTWDPLFLDELARDHRVVIVDYPGVGYSSGRLPEKMEQVASFVAAFATTIDLRQFVLLGWSWGGYVAQAVLVDHPERVTHAILIGTNPPGPNAVPMEQAFLDLAFKPVNDLADEEVLFFEPKSEMSRSAAKASHDRIYARPDVASRIPSKPEEIGAYLKAAGDFREDAAGRRRQLSKTRTPVLILCGDNDISNPTPNWFPLVGQLTNAQFLIYPATGHAPQHQHPEMTADYLKAFLRRAVR